jgi:uncharacterized membrane protein YeaQ/YmgE (transglycosylase-associated protein family)
MFTIGTVFIGVVVGLVGTFITSSPSSGGVILNLSLGVGGALAAYYLGLAMSWYSPASGGSAIAALVGAMTVMLVFRSAVGRRAVPAWR